MVLIREINMKLSYLYRKWYAEKKLIIVSSVAIKFYVQNVSNAELFATQSFL